MTLTRNQREAIHLFGAFTAGAFDFWTLTGSPKASCRAHILTVLHGRKVPQRDAGISALRDAFADVFKAAGQECRAGQDELIANLCTASGAYTPGKPFAE